MTAAGVYAQQAASPQTTTIGQSGDAVLDFAYDSATGDLRIVFDFDPRISASNPFQVLRLSSAGGLFLPANFNASGFSFVTSSTGILNGTTSAAGSIPDGYDLGEVLPIGMSLSALAADLTLKWNVLGGGLTLKIGDLVAASGTGGGGLGNVNRFIARGGNWSDPTNWSLGRTPAGGDIVNVLATGGANLAVTLDAAAAGATGLIGLTIDAAPGATAALSQSVNTLGVAGNVTVGDAGSGTFTQTGGAHNVGTALVLGKAVGSAGVYSLSGTASLSAGSEIIGNGGSGTFNQIGGTNAISGALYIGSTVSGISGSGTYNLLGGNAIATAVYVGAGGTGTLNVANGATLQVSGNLALGDNPADAIHLNGGSITAGTFVLGTHDWSSLDLTAGTFSFFGGIHLSPTVLAIGHGGASNVAAFNQGGGTFGASALLVGSTDGAAGSYSLSGNGSFSSTGAATIANPASAIFISNGGFRVGPLINNGSFSISGGLAAVTALSGGGSISISGNGRLAMQSAVPPAAPGVAVVPAIQITDHGIFDLGNQALLVENAKMPEATVRQYLRNGYNANGTTGIGDWGGYGGITATDAVNSHSGGTNATLKVSVGYVNGVTANDPLFGGQSVVPGLATDRTLISPALNGDLNLDGRVDDTDLFILSGLGQYGKASSSYGWVGGDVNHDGKVDATDLSIFRRAANYNSGSAYSVANPAGTATTSTIGAPPPATIGTRGDGQLDFDYNPATGDLKLNFDSDGRISGGQPLQVVRLRSNTGLLRPTSFNGSAFTLGTSAGAFSLNGTAAGFDAIGDGYDLGTILPAGLTLAQIASDLSIGWNVYGGGLSLKPGDVVASSGTGGGGGNINNYTGASGNWNDAANWSLARAPVAADVVVIAPAGTASIAVAFDATGTVAIAQLAMGGGTGTPAGSSLDIGPGKTLFVNGGASVGPASTLTISGGKFTAGRYDNAGTLLVTGGTGSVATLSGTGTLSISGTGAMVLRPAAAPAVNSTRAVQISSAGTLDLGNQPLLVDNTATPPNAIRQYLKTAYNADPITGIGNWAGKGGITAVDAIASHGGGTNAALTVSVGYLDGATANDPLFAGQPVVVGLASNRTLIRPTLNGDLNLDGRVDDADLLIFSGLGQYGKPATPYGWVSGDLNHDGKVDATDLTIFRRAANYNNGSYGGGTSVVAATPISVPAATVGHHGDGVLDLDYDALTGDLKINFDGDSRVSGSQPLQAIRLQSAGGLLRPGSFQSSAFTLGASASALTLNGTAAALDAVGNGYDLGHVLPAGLTPATVASDLSFGWNVYGGGLALKAGDVVAATATTPTTTIGQLGDGVLDFAYDSATGDFRIVYDFDPRITAAKPLQVIRLKSLGGLFIAGNVDQSAFGAGVTANPFTLNGTASGVNSVPDGYDLGQVLPAGLSLSELAGDLTLQWNVFGGGLTLKAGDLIAGSFGDSGNVENYIGGSGNWSDAANWSLARAPAAGDVVIIAPTGGANVAVTFDSAASGATGLTSLRIDAAAGATASLSQAIGTLAVANSVTVGNTGTGAINQSGGSHTIGRTLVLGALAGSAGTYDLSGTASLTAADETIGDQGAAAFNQTGGMNAVSGGIRIGFGPSGLGSYNLAGGSAQAATFSVGVSGTGVLTVGSGGVLQVSGVVAVGTTSASAIHLAGGTVSAGSLSLPDWSRLDLAAGSVSVAGGSLSPTGTLSIGSGGPSNAAAFTQAGGSYRASALLVGSPDGAAGTFTLAGNGSSFTVTGAATIANAASSIVLAGGTFTAGALDLGGDPARLQWTAGTLRITGTNGAIIGAAAGSPADVVWPGSLALASGQSLSLPAAPLRISNGGTLHLTGGSVAATSLDISGSGQLDWTAGTIAISRLALGAGQGGPFGGPALDLGTARALSADSATIGASAALSVSGGTFLAGSLENAGSLGVAGGTASAVALNNPGTVSVAGGLLTTSTLTNAGALAISGGTASVGALGGTGSVSITGGSLSTTSLSATDWTRINLAAGTFNLSGGSAAALGTLGVGSGGASNAAAFNQLAGSYRASALLVGSPDGAAGSFALAGNASTFTVTGVATVANAASAIALSGGTFTASALDLGGDPTRLHWTGGTLQITGTNGAAIGDAGAGATIDASLPSTLTLGATQALLIPAAPLHIGNAGTLNLSGGAVSATSLDITGAGQLNWTAGTIAINQLSLGGAPGGAFGPSLDVSTGRTLIAGNGASIGPSATLTVSGGSFSAGPIDNAGSVNITAGNAAMGGFTNTGALGITGGTTAADSLSGTGTISIGGAGKLALRRGLGPRPANALPAVQISGSGVLDLGDQPLLVDNALMPDSVVRQYLRSAYNADVSGIGDWKGTGGITSADAITSHAGGTNATLRVSLGYVNGATAADPLFAGQSVVPGLATNRTLISPTLNGDLNLDGKVDENDLFLFSGLGQYAKPATPYGWVSGDLNHDGKVDATDVSIFRRAGNYNNGTYGATASAAWSPALTAPHSTVGAHGDGALDFDYNSLSGDLKINYDGDPRITAAQPLQSIRLISASGILRPNLFQPTAFTLGAGASTTKLTGTAAGLDGVADGYDLGPILQPGLTAALVAADLSAEWNVYGGGLAFKAGDIAAVTLATGTFGQTGDGHLDFLYDPATGDLRISYDGDPAISAAHPLQVLRLSSKGGLFIPDKFNTSAFGFGVTTSPFALNGTASGANSVPDGYDLGDVLSPGLDIRQLAGDLTLQWNVFGGGIQLRTGYLIAPEPQPQLLALGAIALMSLPTRSRRGARSSSS